jgi:hypothetical protein
VIKNKDRIISEQEEVINDLLAQNALLKQQVEWFKRQLFGGGKSEKTDVKQLDLEFIKKIENEPENEKADELLNENDSPKKKSKKRRRREERFEDLPVGEVVVIIPDEVKAEPEKYVEIAEESSFEVEVTPPVFFKKLTLRKKFKRIDNRELPPVIAPAPKKLLEGSALSVNLIVFIIISKFLDHLPLYRLEQIFLRHGLKLARKLMSDWIGRIAVDWLKPIYSYMLEELRKCHYLQVDETTTRYINGKQSIGKTQQGYFWVVHRPGGDVVYLWSTNRCYENVIDLLGEEFEGTLHTDGYGAYASYVVVRSGKVIHAECWAHFRRKLADAEQERPILCRWLIRLINILFAYEREYKKESLGKVAIERRRQSESAMTIKMIKRILDYSRERFLPQGKFGTAIHYGLNQWTQLLEYLNNGNVQISTNLVENAIRPVALGRKNWLFIGHQDAGERAAILYSLLGSCKSHGVDPADYLRDTLNRMLHAKVQDKDFYARLTPQAYKIRQAQEAA